jgi:hypothetical protein
LRLADAASASCELAARQPGSAAFLLVGDSHADSLKDTMREEAARAGVGLRLMKENCALGVNGCTIVAVLAEADRHGITTIILHAAPGTMKPEAAVALAKAASDRLISVELIEPVPIWKSHVLQTLYLTRIGALPLASVPVQSEHSYQDSLRTLSDGLARLGAPPNLRLDPVGPVFCGTGQCLLTDAAGKPLYFDSNHLTLTGARMLSSVFGRIFSESSKSPSALLYTEEH